MTIEIQWSWISADGLDVTGTDEVAGYNVHDFFDADVTHILTLPPNAAYDALVEAYRGPDCDGISLYWRIAGCDRGRRRGDDGNGPDDLSPVRPTPPVMVA